MSQHVVVHGNPFFDGEDSGMQVVGPFTGPDSYRLAQGWIEDQKKMDPRFGPAFIVDLNKP